MNTGYRFETQQLHAGQEEADSATGARAVPIYATTAYVFKDTTEAAERFALATPGNIYTRLMNPTTDVLEQRMATLEGGAGAVAVATGAAAIDYAIRNIARAGDHIVCAGTVYGGTYNLLAHTLQESGIEATFVQQDKVQNFAAAIQANTKLLFVESLANPNSNIADIEGLAAVAHAHGIPLIVDNTFATPYLFRPIEHGADIVVHSASKFICGHGTAMGGIIIDSGKFDWTGSGKFPGISQPCPAYHGLNFAEACGPQAYLTRLRTVLLRDQGATISPFNSFLLLQGLETLSLRVERHVSNAIQIVEYLAKHPQVAKVNHPALLSHPDHNLYTQYYPQGGSSIFTIEIKGGADKARQFCENLVLFSLLANVADLKSLVIHPASTTHSQLSEQELQEAGITPNTVRLSIGTEHIKDLLADLEQAFNKMN